MEYRPYDTYADAYNYDLHEGDHEYKLPYGAESMIKELKEDIQRLNQQNQDDLFDMMRDKRQDRADMIESIVNLVAEYDMSDTIFGEKLLTLLEGMK